MTMFARICTFSLLAVLLSIPSGAYAQRPIDEVEALRGIPGFYVIGDDPEPALSERGIRKATLISTVESRLRALGIDVLDESEWLLVDSAPVLYINVTANRVSESSIVYTVGLEVLYLVHRLHDRSATMYATVWSKESVGVLDPDRSGTLEEDLKTLIDLFVDAYRQSNGDS